MIPLSLVGSMVFGAVPVCFRAVEFRGMFGHWVSGSHLVSLLARYHAISPKEDVMESNKIIGQDFNHRSYWGLWYLDGSLEIHHKGRYMVTFNDIKSSKAQTEFLRYVRAKRID